MLAAGCNATGRTTAPLSECRGREAIYLTDAQVDAMDDDQLERITAHNENVERECGVKAPNPSGRVKRAAR